VLRSSSIPGATVHPGVDGPTRDEAAGLNAVSICFDWQYHSDARYDFTGIAASGRLLRRERNRAVTRARVGPYMNAESMGAVCPALLR